MVYDITSHDAACIEDPVTPDRSDWAAKIAYKQWHIDEIERGEPWLHLKRKLVPKTQPIIPVGGIRAGLGTMSLTDSSIRPLGEAWCITGAMEDHGQQCRSVRASPSRHLRSAC